jgi:hypothetical protein
MKKPEGLAFFAAVQIQERKPHGRMLFVAKEGKF